MLWQVAKFVEKSRAIKLAAPQYASHATFPTLKAASIPSNICHISASSHVVRLHSISTIRHRSTNVSCHQCNVCLVSWDNRVNWAAAGIDRINEAKGPIVPFIAGLAALVLFKHFNTITVITVDDASFGARGLFLYLENNRQ